MKYAILCSFVLGTASVAYGQSRMPPPTYNGNNNSSSSGWDNPQTRSPMTGADPADRVGTFQIMLQGPPLVADTLQTNGRGFGIGQTPAGAGGIVGYFGISGGVGYTLSSLFEVGGAIDFGFSGVSGAGGQSAQAYTFLGEPFIKLNLGPTFKTGALNPYVLAGLAIGASGIGGFQGAPGPQGQFDVDVDPGLEWLVGGRWGFDFYVPLQILVPLSGGQIGLNIGIGYGLVAYL